MCPTVHRLAVSHLLLLHGDIMALLSADAAAQQALQSRARSHAVSQTEGVRSREVPVAQMRSESDAAVLYFRECVRVSCRSIPVGRSCCLVLTHKPAHAVCTARVVKRQPCCRM